MTLKILFIDDDNKLRESLIKIFDQEIIEGYTIIATGSETFEEGQRMVSEEDYDIVILDLYKGDPQKGNPKSGLEVLKTIQSEAFIPVIFYSGLTKDLAGIESEIVSIVNKGSGGIDQLKKEITRIIKSQIALIKKKVHNHIRITLRDYFWNTVHGDKSTIEPVKDDVSIGYLLLRRLAHSLSKENIKVLLEDNKIDPNKIHPMEFYIFPIDTKEYESGEILEKDGNFYAILTPDCDFVLRPNGTRKADYILLVKANKFEEFQDFKTYKTLKEKSNRSKEEQGQLSNLAGKLKNWVGNNQGEKDRYFFLPSTPFINNLVLDFQNKIMVEYKDLERFKRVAKLDTPFSQSMTSSFIRYYNRIGFPDLDIDYILSKF